MSERHGLSDRTVDFVRQVLERHPEIQQAILFGSRAKGTFKNGSDIDLALRGESLTQKNLNRLYEELDELPIPYEFSLVVLDKITDAKVLAHIERVGIIFYDRQTVG